MLKVIILISHIVHVRYSTDSNDVRFSPSRYGINADGVDNNVLLWIESKDNYVVFDTNKVIEKVKSSGLDKEEFFIRRDNNNNYIDPHDNDLKDCILASQTGSKVMGQENIEGLDKFLPIAKKHVAIRKHRSLFSKEETALTPRSKKVGGATLYEVRGVDYSGTKSTDDSVDKEYLHRKQQDDAAQAKVDDSALSTTEKEQVTLARYGQGRFRNAVFKLYGARCVLTGTEFSDVLIASHIMPWAHCETAEQRLDPHNGLLLDRNLDRLFDRGYITFDEKGVLKISPQLSAAGGQELLPDENIQLDLSPETQGYLEYHRKKIFRKQ